MAHDNQHRLDIRIVAQRPQHELLEVVRLRQARPARRARRVSHPARIVPEDMVPALPQRRNHRAQRPSITPDVAIIALSASHFLHRQRGTREEGDARVVERPAEARPWVQEDGERVLPGLEGVLGRVVLVLEHDTGLGEGDHRGGGRRHGDAGPSRAQGWPNGTFHKLLYEVFRRSRDQSKIRDELDGNEACIENAKNNIGGDEAWREKSLSRSVLVIVKVPSHKIADCVWYNPLGLARVLVTYPGGESTRGRGPGAYPVAI